MFGNHGLGGLLKEGAHEKSPKCLGGNLGDFGEFCKGLLPFGLIQAFNLIKPFYPQTRFSIQQSNISQLLSLNRKGRLKHSDGLDTQALPIKRTIHAS